ncbi:MAG: histidinol dehydrogenase [Phycisphaerae bacterium]|nr:histidinol dehydrogenase [Phycisphaerae bacterium]MDW8261145.1 histidinol dehydrogenase [Phycisphaerales bacterium]
MLPIWKLENSHDRMKVEARLERLRIHPARWLTDAELAARVQVVRETIADVAERGDAAVVEAARRFDDPRFTREQIAVTDQELSAAGNRVNREVLQAMQHAIAQLREYQTHILPSEPPELTRVGVRLALRFCPVDSAGCYVPAGKAAYPSTLIHLVVPAQVAGVREIAVCIPPSRYGRSDILLAACQQLGISRIYRAGGVAAVAAMALGTETIRRVDKIVGPGNDYVQLAKLAVAGGVGIDGYLGPSEIVVIADEAGRPDFIAADLIAQAEHDPGSCFLLTPSLPLACAVSEEISRQLQARSRREAIERSLASDSAAIVTRSMDETISLANRIAAEHVNLQCSDNEAVLRELWHAGAVFVGPWSPVAAGDYVAGPSHCLPTNTTARFTSGVSVFDFLKRSAVVRYEPSGIQREVSAIVTLAREEHLDGHAASALIRAERHP